jgi:hypothetical protein
MMKALVSSYRLQFNSSFKFIAVQLPGYTDGAFDMRIKQDEGAMASLDAAVIATCKYFFFFCLHPAVCLVRGCSRHPTADDDSCAMDKTHGCPHGNVHNVHKEPVGKRAALKIRAMTLGEGIVSEGPRAQAVSATGTASAVTVTVVFSGGTAPFYFAPTRNCTTCCNGVVSDFDAAAGPNSSESTGNGTDATITGNGSAVRLTFAGAAPKWVRYTANRVFPQCALYNKEGLPALPFVMEVK